MPLPQNPLKKLALTKNQTAIVMGVGIAVVILVALVFLNLKGGSGGAEPVTLVVWGTESREVFETLTDTYRAVRPNVQLSYESLPESQYKNRLATALAAGKGPDVFVIGNRDLYEYKDILSPADPEAVPLSRFRNLYPSAVERDLTFEGSVYALPLYMDTLVLVYNRSLFDRAGVPVPPSTWDELRKLVPRLRTLNASGQVVQAAVTLGGSEKNIAHAIDVLNLIMIQNGSSMNEDPESFRADFFKGGGTAATDAFDFYLSFGDAGSPFYTWNDAQPDSLEAFASGKVVMTFAYHSELEGIARRSPFLDLGVAPMPQIFPDNPVNYAQYDGLGVSLQSAAPGWGWDFVRFVSENTRGTQTYFDLTGNPPALRSMIGDLAEDEDLGMFVNQSLTAKHWRMTDYDTIVDIFGRAIENASAGRKSSREALREVEVEINRIGG